MQAVLGPRGVARPRVLGGGPTHITLSLSLYIYIYIERERETSLFLSMYIYIYTYIYIYIYIFVYQTGTEGGATKGGVKFIALW